MKLFENNEEIRVYIEDIVKDRANEKGLVYELAADGERKCLVQKCKFKAYYLSTARGFCRFHSSVGHVCLSLVNGHICSTIDCNNKARIFEELCKGCYSPGHEELTRKELEKENREKTARWSKEKSKQIQA